MGRASRKISQGREVSDDYFSWRANKLAPKPAHKRPAPDKDKLNTLPLSKPVAEIEESRIMEVEEDTASTGILRKLFRR